MDTIEFCLTCKSNVMVSDSDPLHYHEQWSEDGKLSFIRCDGPIAIAISPEDLGHLEIHEPNIFDPAYANMFEPSTEELAEMDHNAEDLLDDLNP